MTMNIYSPMAAGNGAYIMHRTLESAIPGYRVCAYNAWGTLFLPALYALCRNGHPDIIHSTLVYAIFSTRKHTPLVVTFHGYGLDSAMQQYTSPPQNLHYSTDLKWFIRKAIHKASKITAVSRFTAELVRRETGLKRDIRVIHNGIDETRFSLARAGEVGTPGINVLFIGNLTRKKGADLLPEIAARLNPGIRILYTSDYAVTSSCRHVQHCSAQAEYRMRQCHNCITSAIYYCSRHCAKDLVSRLLRPWHVGCRLRQATARHCLN